MSSDWRYKDEHKAHYDGAPVDRIPRVPLSMDVRLFALNQHESGDAHTTGPCQWPVHPGPGGSQMEPHHMLCIEAARRWFDTSKQHRLDVSCSPALQKIRTENDYPIKWL